MCAHVTAHRYTWSAAKPSPAPIIAVHGTATGKDKEQTSVSAEHAALWLQATQASASSKVVTVPSDWYVFEDASGGQATLAAVDAFFKEHIAPEL